MKHVPHLYLPGPWPAAAVPLDDSHVHHLTRVLRLGAGRRVTYTDGQGVVGSGQFDGAEVERGSEELLTRKRVVHAVVAPPTDRDRQRFAVEKLAELGVARLSWLDSRFGRGRMPRLDRAEAWARSALEQSRGAWHMEIGDTPVAFSDVESDALICDPGGSSTVPDTRAVTFVVGPEGGWAPGEVPETSPRLGLGDRILRVETAAIVAAVAVLGGT